MKAFFTDNYKPVLTASKEVTFEGGENVTLSCKEDTSDSILSYAWFKNKQKIMNATVNTFVIESHTSNEGNYSCRVNAKITGESANSDIKFIRILSKYIYNLQF